MKNRKLFAWISTMSLLSALVLPCVGCSDKKEDKDSKGTKTHVTVYSYNGGVGTAWLDEVIERFEAAYADVSFEEGKMGVVVDDPVIGQSNIDSVITMDYDVIFSESVTFNDLIAKGSLMDISDIVTESLSNITDGAETGSIEDKMDVAIKTALKAQDGKYYMLPHYELYTGVTYDVDLFYEYSLYFKEGGGWTRNDGEMSVGPDGVRGTYDDGLPSSYEEFYALMDRMVSQQVTPFIYTGQYTNYTNDLLAGCWSAYSGKNEFELNVNFDSAATGTKARIINGFDGNTPVVEEVDITSENGYLMSRSAGKYYALSLLEKILGKSSYRSSKITGTLSHLDAQTEYIYSNLEQQDPIAMLIDGSYWVYEARDAFARSENTYKEAAKDRNFSWMPMPRQYAGSVTEGKGTKNALLDTMSSFAGINAKTAGNAAKTAAAKAFLQFCYTDESLVNFTTTTGVMKALQYNVPADELAKMTRFSQNLYEIRQNSDIIYPYSDNPIFMNDQGNFFFLMHSSVWKSRVNGTPYVCAYTAMRQTNAVTAEQYFRGGWTTQEDWNSAYSQYFTAA